MAPKKKGSVGGGSGSSSSSSGSDGDSWTSKLPLMMLSFLFFVIVMSMMRNGGPAASSNRPKTKTTVRGPNNSNRRPPPAPPIPSQSVHKDLSPAAIATFKSDTEAVRKMLTDYYGGEKPMVDTWGYPLNIEGLDTVGEKMARSLKYGKPFVIGVIGSSVAAGHDNCNYDSFERQLERLLSPVFEKAGIDFVVRNAGEGGSCGDNMWNQIFCIRNMVGDDVDVTIYSWTYFEASWMKKRDELMSIHERFARWSLKMDRAPTPLFVNVDENSAPWNGWDSLIKRYGKYGTNVIYLQKYLNTIGFKRKWNEIGDGMHDTTRYGEKANATRKKSLGVVFRNWHPGPLGFQLVSDTLAWSFTGSMLKAAEQLAAGKAINEKPPLMYESKLPPHECKWEPKFCETEEPPSCINFEKPTYGNGQIRISTGDKLNPWYGAYTEDHKEVLKPERELIPREEREAPECKHLDVCRAFTSDTFMTFRLPRIELGVITICCFGGSSKKCGEDMADNLEFFLDKTKLQVSKDDVGPDKCLTVQKQWSEVADAGGHLYLAVNMSKANGIAISHLYTI